MSYNSNRFVCYNAFTAIYRHLLLVFFLSFFIGLAPSGAQVKQESDEAIVSIQFSVYYWQNQRYAEYGSTQTPAPKLHYRVNQEWKSFQTRAAYRTSKMRYTGPDPLILYTEEEVRNPETGELMTRMEPYCVVRIPQGATNLMAFLYPGATETSEEWGELQRAQVINIGSTHFKPGEPVFVNLSDQNVAFQYDDRRAMIQAGGMQSLEAPKEAGRHVIKIATKVADSWKPVLTTSLALPSERVSLVFLEPVKGSSHWQLVRVLLD
ncbi:hypothetical protein QEH59_06745 [Coraliomargarita sp. SDUM461004]|uniref:DUF3108 domain-containing protein n=1 Tax=Thalassobacterium sedimentorum TaxID=3041258 RepID=A0ABU1AHB0_9BACT|nr:hypothetical protein [Coraliomargarita sp. SDUM461004]MDQ8194114.1 hypothetical protein [Coraliomargarita sp. SDUM461004]